MEPSDDDELATRGGPSASPAGVGGAKLSVAAGGVTVVKDGTTTSAAEANDKV